MNRAAFVPCLWALNISFSRCDSMPGWVAHPHGKAPSSTSPSKDQKNKGTSQKWNDNWDMLNNSKPKSVRQIILVRHGQYNEYGESDDLRGLTDLGRKQAAATGERLKELQDGKIIYPINTVYYSTMRRATESFEAMLPSLPELPPHKYMPCSMIREGAVYRPDPPNPNWKVTDESFLRDGKRAEAAFVHYIHRAFDAKDDDKKDGEVKTKRSENSGNHAELLVCHGNIIRFFVMRALQLPPEAWLRTAVFNASITVLTIYPSGKVSLTCFGDVGHLPPDMITYH